MNVGELRKMLEQYPDEMEIITSWYSGDVTISEIISEDEWLVVSGVEKDGWVMHSHPTMSKEDKSREKRYLLVMEKPTIEDLEKILDEPEQQSDIPFRWYKSVDDLEYKLQFNSEKWEDIPFILEGHGIIEK